MKELSDAATTSEAALGKAKEKLKRTRAEALQSGLQSMVRLCVVAPTVNVQVAGGAPGAPSESLSCKAALPSSRLRAIMTEQVLPRFTSLFLQQADATAPDGSPIDAWLRVLAEDMQASIETHLHAQFSGTGGGRGGAVGVGGGAVGVGGGAVGVGGGGGVRPPDATTFGGGGGGGVPRPSTSKPGPRGRAGSEDGPGGGAGEDAAGVRSTVGAARPSTSSASTRALRERGGL